MNFYFFFIANRVNFDTVIRILNPLSQRSLHSRIPGRSLVGWLEPDKRSEPVLLLLLVLGNEQGHVLVALGLLLSEDCPGSLLFV